MPRKTLSQNSSFLIPFPLLLCVVSLRECGTCLKICNLNYCWFRAYYSCLFWILTYADKSDLNTDYPLSLPSALRLHLSFNLLCFRNVTHVTLDLSNYILQNDKVCTVVQNCTDEYLLTVAWNIPCHG